MRGGNLGEFAFDLIFPSFACVPFNGSCSIYLALPNFVPFLSLTFYFR